ncbi:MAG: hypothetical protein HUU35_05190 [Armatimonadetes bacterium]|nr:hypothetical protein [Armatimonadota bacterium]
MTTNLILQEPRAVLDEPGFGLCLDFGARRGAAIRELRKAGYLTTAGVWHDDLAGHLCGQPDFGQLTGMDSAAWNDVTGDWTNSGSRLTPGGGYAEFYAEAGSTTWALEDLADQPAGRGRFVSLICYDSRESDGGQGTNSPITLYIPTRWKVDFADDGSAVLFEQLASVDAEGNTQTSWEPRLQFEWMTAESFAAEPATPHWLWVYEVGAKLIIRNLSPSLEGRLAGGIYVDPALAADETPHVIGAGKWRVEGGGRIALNLSPQKFKAGPASISGAVTAIGADGSTQKCSASYSGLAMSPVEAVIACIDEDDDAWDQGEGELGRRVHGIGWTVSFTSTDEATCFVTGVRVKVPRTTRSDGGVGTDVLAVSNVADKAIELSREGDLTRESLTATLQSYQVDLAAYTQANMAVRYVVDGVTLFRGLSSAAEWRVIADLGDPTGQYTLRAEGLWRRFRKALWPGGEPFDGRLLTDCLAEVLEAAGLTDSDYELASWEYRFPDPPAGEPPALDFRPGTSIDRILEDLQSKFYGTSLFHYFRLSDGKFVLANTTAGAVAASFYQTSAAADLAGVPHQTIRDGSYQETLDDSEQYNYIAVLGEAHDGRPLLARAIDWGSIRDRTAFNFVGEVWPLVVADPGLTSQAAVNYVCRQLYLRHRNPKVYAQWQSLRLNLFPGQVVQLVGANYGSSYQLKGLSLRQSADGEAADPAGLAAYQGEKLL